MVMELDTTATNDDGDTSKINDSTTTDTNNNCWGRLVSVNPLYPHVEILDEDCTFGRNSACSVPFTDKKISSKHCRIYRKKEEGQVDYHFYIDDYSSNGTFVNRKRVGKGNTIAIVSGNEISLTTNIEPSDPTRIMYLFQDLDKLRREEQLEKEKENEESGFTLVADDIPNEISMLSDMSPIKKENSNLSSSESGNTNSNNNDNSIDGNNNNQVDTIQIKKATSTIDSSNNTPSATTKPLKRKSSEMSILDENLNKKKLDTKPDESTDINNGSNNNNNNKDDKTNSTPSDNSILPTSTTATTATSTISTKPTTSTTTDTTITVNNTPTKSINDNDNDNLTSPFKTIPKKKEMDVEESMGENLICGICADTIYKCLTLIPCMHNFCISCYGEWRVGSIECPQCRQTVKSAQKNHAINNLIELYLKKNPEKIRDPEELKSMDERCKITDDMLKKGLLNKSSRKYEDDYDEDDEDDDEYYEGDQSDDDSDEHMVVYHPPKCTFCSPNPPNLTTGYQCPPSPANPTYQNQTPHLNCAHCHKLFPKQTPEPPGIRCGFCNKAYCNLYQACYLGGNFGKMKDLPVNMIPTDTFGGNQYEIKILSDYLAKNGKSVRQLYLDLLEDLTTKKLIIPAGANIILPADPCTEQLRCLGCASAFFSKALFYYRLSIPKDQLPDYAIRDPCYYGRNCRTQFSKFDHAKRLNHICDQTKFQ